MALEITGRLVKIMPQQTGSGSRGNWVKQEFVIETTEQYPKKVCCSLWGDKAESLKNYREGDEVKVSFNLESREYNERWYTDVRAWKLEPAASGKKSAPQNQESSPSMEISGEEEDLPF
jgi:hypothetical protein